MGGNPQKEVTCLKLFSKIEENKAFYTTGCISLKTMNIFSSTKKAR
jgi:hypothetical protein